MAPVSTAPHHLSGATNAKSNLDSMESRPQGTLIKACKSNCRSQLIWQPSTGATSCFLLRRIVGCLDWSCGTLETFECFHHDSSQGKPNCFPVRDNQMLPLPRVLLLSGWLHHLTHGPEASFAPTERSLPRASGSGPHLQANRNFLGRKRIHIFEIGNTLCPLPRNVFRPGTSPSLDGPHLRMNAVFTCVYLASPAWRSFLDSAPSLARSLRFMVRRVKIFGLFFLSRSTYTRSNQHLLSDIAQIMHTPRSCCTAVSMPRCFHFRQNCKFKERHMDPMYVMPPPQVIRNVTLRSSVHVLTLYCARKGQRRSIS